MDPVRHLSPVEAPAVVWQEPLQESESESEGFDSFIGVCMGLGIGALTWAVLLSAWYVLIN